MADKTGIGWTDATWNPATGCDKVSLGCDNCYAMTLAARFKKSGVAAYQKDGDPLTSGPGFGVTLHPDRLDQPLRWTKPRFVFVNSMSDLFHPEIEDDFIHQVFDIMGEADRHTFQVLTKRSKRLMEMAPQLTWHPNVWIGVSVETDRYAFRARHLSTLDQAAVRFVSAEPLLGPLGSLDFGHFDWIIVGGESGINHRHIEADWVRDLRDRSRDASVPFFFKQWGGVRATSGGCDLDGTQHKEMPFGLPAPK